MKRKSGIKEKQPSLSDTIGKWVLICLFISIVTILAYNGYWRYRILKTDYTIGIAKVIKAKEGRSGRTGRATWVTLWVVAPDTAFILRDKTSGNLERTLNQCFRIKYATRAPRYHEINYQKPVVCKS